MEQNIERQLRLSYDKEADVLYVSFGAPREAVSEETGEGMLLRRQPETGEIVGITVLDFEKRFERREGTAFLPIVLDHVSAA